MQHMLCKQTSDLEFVNAGYFLMFIFSFTTEQWQLWSFLQRADVFFPLIYKYLELIDLDVKMPIP